MSNISLVILLFTVGVAITFLIIGIVLKSREDKDNEKKDLKPFLEKMVVYISFFVVSVVSMFSVENAGFLVLFIIKYGMFSSAILIGSEIRRYFF